MQHVAIFENTPNAELVAGFAECLRVKKDLGRGHNSSRKAERGVTIFIVAVAMVSLLAMAVLAIDIVSPCMWRPAKLIRRPMLQHWQVRQRSVARALLPPRF
jgi:hypothetical protein